jgi:hypothetical protein
MTGYHTRLSPADFAEQTKKWGKVIRTTGIKAD